ncbi:hypothetical protein [Pseudoxanthomonas putridarboris]|uniref:TspB protein n=1 Tax=Pseudoxanthomonas putridarboris TaxID=752605 RepID=A0ABU9IZI6_9GAMM
MNIARIFANAFARRIVYVVIALVLAWLGIGSVKAGTYGCDVNSGCEESAAYAACLVHVGAVVGGGYCQKSSGFYQVYSSGGNPIGGTGLGRYFFAASCSQRPSQVTQFLPLTGSTQCWNGCVVSYLQNGDDETSTRSATGDACTDAQFKDNCPSNSFWNGYMGVCQPIAPDCAEGETREDGICKPDNKCPEGMIAVTGATPGAIQQGAMYCKPAQDECPPGNVMSPGGQCLPGEGQCASGEARRDNGTCGRDSDGDGKADEDDDDPNNDPGKESASGGDSCKVPPSCSGGAIACMQVKIQWRIDCNTRKTANISGGACTAQPVCVGENCNAMEYAQLLQQWRTTCALEKMTGGLPGSGGGNSDANGNGVPDALEGRLTPSTGGEGEDSTSVSGKGVSTSLLDTGNIFGGGSCPAPPTLTIMGVSVSGADFPHWCNAMAILRALILIFGAFTALKILMGWGF